MKKECIPANTRIK